MDTNTEAKIVSTFMVTINEHGGMSFKDAGLEGQTPLSAADMADMIVNFGKTLEKYHDEERMRELIREESSAVIAQYIRAQKDLFTSIDAEKKVKQTPDVITDK